MTYSLDIAALTVIATDAHGERHDLNAGGAPCVTLDDLRSLVSQLGDQGAYDDVTTDALLADIG
jgi:hypothetical protein